MRVGWWVWVVEGEGDDGWGDKGGMGRVGL